MTGTNLGAYDANPFGDGLVATGLDNLRARQFDPVNGRFLSLDPLAPQDYSTPYAYVANRALGYVDPSGLRRAPNCSLLCSLGWSVVNAAHHPRTYVKSAGSYAASLAPAGAGVRLGEEAAAAHGAVRTGWDVLEPGLRGEHQILDGATGGLVAAVPFYGCYQYSKRIAENGP